MNMAWSAVIAIVVLASTPSAPLSIKSVCEEGTFQCGYSSECITQEKVCDGHTDCLNSLDETNCTVTPVLPVPQKSNINLAWLVTPCLFLLGLFYAVGRCIYDGICCNRERLIARMRNLSGDSSSSQRRQRFFPLSIRTSTQIPLFNPGPSAEGRGNQLLLIHDQSFSIAVAPPGDSSVKLPSYEEATSVPLMTDEELPPYSEVEFVNPPQYSITLTPTHTDQPTRFQPHERRRHRSQQETSRRSSFSRRRHRSQENYHYTSLLESDESA